MAFALAGVLHAGFQLTVTALVYPALGDLPAASWRAAHARHSRRITPVVGVVYLALLLSGGWFVVSGPGPLGWLALAGAAGALVVTALLAAPTHGRLGEHEPALVHRLLAVDRVRCLLAVLGGAAGAAGALVPGLMLRG